MRELSAAERTRITSQISMSLANLQSVHLFWCPPSRRLYARSVKRLPEDCYRGGPGCGQRAVPSAAIYIGTFYHGEVKTRQILEDLEATIAEAPEPAESEPAEPARRPRRLAERAATARSAGG